MFSFVSSEKNFLHKDHAFHIYQNIWQHAASHENQGSWQDPPLAKDNNNKAKNIVGIRKVSVE